MIDIGKSLDLIKGALFDAEVTWERYLPEAGDWKKTAALLTGPLIVGSAIVSYLLSVLFAPRNPFFPSPTLMSTLWGIVIAAVAAMLIAFVVAILAGVFKGKNSFPHALAATSLAFVPGYVGQALMYIPWIGSILGLVLGIYGLVLLWRILPKYLDVPGTARTGHYILSLLGSIVVFIAVGSVLGAGMVARQISIDPEPSSSRETSRSTGNVESDEAGSSGSGVFAGMQRQAQIMEAAEQDVYAPPADGKLSRRQVRNFVTSMTETVNRQKSQVNALEEMGERAEANESVSFSEAMSGIAGVVNITAAEMEVVKSSGGNWAEHQWVGEQLRVARYRRDDDEAAAHNYELYLEVEDELSELENW